MKLTSILLIAIASFFAINYTANAFSYEVKNFDPRNIIVLPEGASKGDYEILKRDGVIKLSRSLHPVKSISWLVKDGGPSTNRWKKYTATVNMPVKIGSYGTFIIHKNGHYIDMTNTTKLGTEGDAKATNVTDSENIYPRGVEEGKISN
jgi:hypothetical protein